MTIFRTYIFCKGIFGINTHYPLSSWGDLDTVSVDSEPHRICVKYLPLLMLKGTRRVSVLHVPIDGRFQKKQTGLKWQNDDMCLPGQRVAGRALRKGLLRIMSFCQILWSNWQKDELNVTFTHVMFEAKATEKVYISGQRHFKFESSLVSLSREQYFTVRIRRLSSVWGLV